MERMIDNPGVVHMKGYSFDTLDVENDRIGILIITLQEEVIGTLRDFRIMHEHLRTPSNVNPERNNIIHSEFDHIVRSRISPMNLSERVVLKKAKELIQGLKSVFDASCYNYSLAETVILICSQNDSIRLCDFGAQDFCFT